MLYAGYIVRYIGGYYVVTSSSYYDDFTIEVMTTSEDGYVKWWDLRNLQQPTLQWRLQDINKQEGQVLRVIPHI